MVLLVRRAVDRSWHRPVVRGRARLRRPFGSAAGPASRAAAGRNLDVLDAVVPVVLLYCGAFVGAFTAFWQWFSPHPWWRWSILGTALIVFVTYLQVEVSVAINNWYGPFYDLIQAALGHAAPVTLGQFYGELATFAYIATAAVTVAVLNLFPTSHYVFRWRTAMNDYYMSHWPVLRGIEGAAQRVQEDTMRFSSTTEDMGGSFINSVLTLIAFLPVLWKLGEHVTRLPLVGVVPHALVVAALVWSASAQDVDSSQYEFPSDELAYIQHNAIQLDHQQRFSVSAGVAYKVLPDTEVHGDFLYGDGLRAGFANLQKLPGYYPLNVGAEQTVHLFGADLRLRLDILNVFDRVYELRNGSGLGIAAPAYGPRRAVYGGIKSSFW